MGQWLPLAGAVLNAVCRQLPSPAEMTTDRLQRLLSSSSSDDDRCRLGMQRCDGADDAPTVVFVSKMVAVERRAIAARRAPPRNQLLPGAEKQVSVVLVLTIQRESSR